MVLISDVKKYLNQFKNKRNINKVLIMGIFDWFKKHQNDETENEPLRRLDETEIEEIPIKEQFMSEIHCGAKYIIINDDFFLTETLTIDVDDIVIDGQNHTIQASGRETPILLITSNNVTLKNITFKNGNCDKNGGGAINNTSGNLNIINCSFNGNSCHNGDGGAIYNLDGILNIHDCKFIGNYSNRGDGGAIYNLDGEVNISDECIFEKNSSKFGGAIYNGKILNLKNTTFKNNKSVKGLSIFNTDDTTISECSFEITKVNDLKTNAEIHNLGRINIESTQKERIQEITQGGFIHIKNDNAKTFKFLNSLIGSGEKEIKLDFDIFNKEYKVGIDINEDDIIIDGDNNIIDGLGKAIFNINGNNITLKNINFRNGSTFKGGAINNSSDSLTLIDCNFDCNISNKGGAINNEGVMELNNCNFNKNIANESDGGAINNNGELKLNNCNFINNSSHKNGGAINNLNILHINGGEFESNRAKNNGASINNAKNASLNLLNTRFENNIAKEKGSVIFNDNNVEMKKCFFSNNISTEISNIIFQHGDENSHLCINDCIFSRERFSNNLIFIENGSCNVFSSEFKLTKERENSHVIYNENGILKIKELEFENINSEIAFNNNIIFIERNKNMEQYIKQGAEGQPFKYIQ